MESRKKLKICQHKAADKKNFLNKLDPPATMSLEDLFYSYKMNRYTVINLIFKRGTYER